MNSFTLMKQKFSVNRNMMSKLPFSCISLLNGDVDRNAWFVRRHHFLTFFSLHHKVMRPARTWLHTVSMSVFASIARCPLESKLKPKYDGNFCHTKMRINGRCQFWGKNDGSTLRRCCLTGASPSCLFFLSALHRKTHVVLRQQR